MLCKSFNEKCRLIIVVVCSFMPVVLAGAGQNDGRISKPGEYRSYSHPIFDGWERSSFYVSTRDGTRLAMDLFRPTLNGKLHDSSLPVIWEHRRYFRASIDKQGKVSSQLDRENHPLRQVIRHGYIIAIVDVRGSGASFGSRVDPFAPQESLDAYDVTEWLAVQSWCNGKVGMYGISYSGTSQLMAAATAPPHLKAIFPEMTMFDLYDNCYPGGIYRYITLQNWARRVQGYDLFETKTPAPVDSDADQQLLRQALEQHRGNADVNHAAKAIFRDSAIIEEEAFYQQRSPSTYLEQLNKSQVAIYLRAGWFDMYPRDMLLLFKNLNTPKKIVIGSWNHYQSQGIDRATELLRWFDYWLKGIDNGIMKEPPILYSVNGLPHSKSLRWAYEWPPTQAQPVPYYFCAGPCGSIRSVNSGQLRTSPSDLGMDRYAVNTLCTSGKKTRWTGGSPAYLDMTKNDQMALTYTTVPLAEAVELVGHPVVHLWLQSEASDVDVFVYLEEIDDTGKSTYITEGCLRASHRKTVPAPYDSMGLPYHRSCKSDKTRLPDEPVELVLDLLPTANYFDIGHRIRITITCADKDNYRSLYQTEVPEIKILRDRAHASRIMLPIRKKKG